MSAQLQLVKRESALPQTWEETMSMAEVFARSGLFADTKDAAQAVVKICAGRELGIGPIASLRGIDIIQGKIALSANLIAALIKRPGSGYSYRVVKSDEQGCSIEFSSDGKPLAPIVTFTIQDAQRAGLTNKQTWKQYPRNMLFARAMTNGARMHCPDVFSGAVYTLEELASDETVATIPATVELVEENQPAASPTGSRAATDAEMITQAQGRSILALCKAKGRDAQSECRAKYDCDYGELSREKAGEFIDYLTALPSLTDREHVRQAIKSKIKELVIAEHPAFVDVENGKAKYSAARMLKWLRATAKAKWSIEVNPDTINSGDDLPDSLLVEVPALLQVELNELIESRNQQAENAPQSDDGVPI